MIETAKELTQKCLELARNYQTLYVMGCFGSPMTKANQERYIAHHSYNRRAAREAMIRSANGDIFGFDCVCMIKGLLWGWDGDKSKSYGGAAYGSRNVPDISSDQMIRVCREISTDFGNMLPGELLWTKGHVGIYVGDGNAVECTPAWENGVQLTVVKNIKEGTGHNWTKHGKLPYIRYDDAGDASSPDNIPVLRRGEKSDAVKILQVLLNHRSANGSLESDGSFGPATEAAVKQYQSSQGIAQDGIAGAITWKKLLGI